MKKEAKYKLFGRRMTKRVTAVIMAAVMLFSCVYGTAPSVTAKSAAVKSAAVKSAAVKSKDNIKSAAPGAKPNKFKTVALGRLSTYRNHLVSKVITGLGKTIDNATGDDTASKITSWINAWVLGMGTTGAKLAEISAKLDEIIDMCNEILDELDDIERQLANLESELVTTEISMAKTNMDEAWRSDADLTYVSSGKYSDVGTALEAFQNYMQAAQDYEQAVEDGSTAGIKQAEDNLSDKEETYERQLAVIYANRNSIYLNKEVKEDMFLSTDVNVQITGAIDDLRKKLCGDGITDTYTDYAAQYAYLTRGFTEDQYDFIMTCMQRQLLQICNLEIMYQDYLSRQNDYLLENYGDDTETLNGFQTKVLEPFAEVNDNFCIAAGDRMVQKIRFSPSSEATTTLNAYMTSADNLFYEDNRKNTKGIPAVIQRGVLNPDGTVSAYWITKNTQESEEYDEDTNEMLRSMSNFEKGLLYSGIGNKPGRSSTGWAFDLQDNIKNIYLSAGDLIFTKLFDLYPDNVKDYNKMEIVDDGYGGYNDLYDIFIDPKSQQLWDVSKKLGEIHKKESNFGEGEKWSEWIPEMFDKAYVASGNSPQAYLADQLGDFSYLMKDFRSGKAIRRTYVSSSVKPHVDVTFNTEKDIWWYIDFMNLDKSLETDGNNITEIEVLRQNHDKYEYDDIPAEEDHLDIYCANPMGGQRYRQNVRLKNTKSAELVGTDKNSQVNAGDTVTLKFDKKQGDKVPMAVKYYQYNGMGDNYSDDKLYQDGEVVVDYDEIQALMQDDSEDQVELEIPIRYALNAAYEVVYGETVGDVKNLKFSSDREKNELTISFDKIANASKADVCFAEDKKFEKVVLSDIIDIDKDFSDADRITKTYSLKVDSGKRLYMRIVGYAEREYGTVYGTAITCHSLLAPVITGAVLTSMDGDVDVTLSASDGDAGTYQVEFSPADQNFQGNRITETVEGSGELTVTARLTPNEHYYIRAREQSYDFNGGAIYSDWGEVYTELYTAMEFDNIEKIEVLDSTTSVRVTAAESGNPLCEGYRFVAFSEDAPTDKLKDWFSEVIPPIDEEYRTDVDYIEVDKSGDLACVFENLPCKKWYFFVQIYYHTQYGQKEYSNKEGDFDIAEIDLRPHVQFKDVQLTDVENITVICLSDLVSTHWKAEVVDPADNYSVKEEKTAPVTEDSLSMKLDSRDYMIRISCWREDPATGKSEGGYKSDSGYVPYLYWDQKLSSKGDDVYYAGVNGYYDEQNIRVMLKHDQVMNYSYCKYSLVSTDEDVEPVVHAIPLETDHTFLRKDLTALGYDWGYEDDYVTQTPKPYHRYRIGIQPYNASSADAAEEDRTYGQYTEVYVYYGPPKFEGALLIEPMAAYGDIMTEGAPFKIIASTGESGDFMPDTMHAQVMGAVGHIKPHSGSNGVDFDLDYDEKYNRWSNPIAHNILPDPDAGAHIQMYARWTDPSTGKHSADTYWSDIPLDFSQMPEYTTFAEWLENHGDDVSILIQDDTEDSAVQTMSVKGLRAVSGDSKGGSNYIVKVKLPEKMETESGDLLEFHGISVKLTKDKAGKNVIAGGYERGRELFLTELEDGEYLKEGKSYYVWISPFNYGDKEEKVILNGGYVGPFKVTAPVSGEDTDTDISGQPTPTPTAVPTPNPAQVTPTPTAKPGQSTPKPATGLGVGKKATAGSGATKAVYKATGKNTVTYQKTKVEKYAGTVTVPATVKINGKKYKVTKIAKSAFKGYKDLKTVVIKPKGLKKKKITGCFKGTSVEIAYVPKKQYKKYKKFFTKKVTKSKVKVTVEKK